MFMLYAVIVTDCTRMCQNGGALDEGNCGCDCVGGFSGTNCESECEALLTMYPNMANAQLGVYYVGPAL